MSTSALYGVLMTLVELYEVSHNRLMSMARLRSAGRVRLSWKKRVSVYELVLHENPPIRLKQSEIG